MPAKTTQGGARRVTGGAQGLGLVGPTPKVQRRVAASNATVPSKFDKGGCRGAFGWLGSLGFGGLQGVEGLFGVGVYRG